HNGRALQAVKHVAQIFDVHTESYFEAIRIDFPGRAAPPAGATHDPGATLTRLVRPVQTAGLDAALRRPTGSGSTSNATKLNSALGRSDDTRRPSPGPD